jgi:hypothetical protein
MSGDDKTKQTPAGQPERGNDPDYGRHDGDHTEHLTRAQIDEEIAAMEQHSRRQTQTLELNSPKSAVNCRTGVAGFVDRWNCNLNRPPKSGARFG